MHTNLVAERKKNQFMEELVLQLPTMDPEIREVVAHLFTIHGNNAEEFGYFINEIPGHDELKQKIINIAIGVLNNEPKRKAQGGCDDREAKRVCLEANPNKRKADAELKAPNAKRQHLKELDADALALSSANEFLEQLIEDGAQVENLDEKIAFLMILLAAENRCIANAAWTCLSRLKELENFKAIFCKEEKLKTLTLLLEKFAKSHGENAFAESPDIPPLTELSSISSRLIAVLLSLPPTQDVEIIAGAVNCLTQLLVKCQKDSNVNVSLGHEEVKPLMALLHGENDQLIWASLCIQNAVLWDPQFDEGLRAEGIKKNIDIVLCLLKNTKNGDCVEAIFNYLKKLYNHFNGEATCKPIFNALPETLLAFSENEDLVIVAKTCWYLSDIDDMEYHRAFCQAGGLKRMLSLLHDYNHRYQAAIELQNEQSPHLKKEEEATTALLEKIVLFTMGCLSKPSSFFDASFAQSLCEVLIAMLKQQPSAKITIAAACQLANLSKTSKENFRETTVPIGLQGIEPLVELLIAKNEEVVKGALWALLELTWSEQNRQYLLKTKAFEHVKALLLEPKDQFAGTAFRFWGKCIEAKGNIDDADIPLIQKRLFPALNGKHVSAAAGTLSQLLSVEGFPKELGREVLETVLLLLKNKENPIVERAYWCLGKLSKLGLADEINQTGILEDIETLFNTEKIPEIVIEGACFFLCETVLQLFKQESIQHALICLISRCFDKKYFKVQEAACWLSYKLACEYQSSLTQISHATFAKGMKLLGSPHEKVAIGAMWMAGKLCPLPSNCHKSLLEADIDPLLEWLKKGNEKTQILALRVIGAMCVNCPAIPSAVSSKGALAVLLPLLARKPIQETLLWVIASLVSLPEVKAGLRQAFNENSIMNFLKSENPKIKEAMIFILGNILSADTFAQFREEAIQLIWPTPPKAEDDHLYDRSLFVLAKLLSRDEIIKRLQSASNMSKQDFLIFLSIISIQQSSIPAIEYVSPFPNTPSAYKSWYQPYGETKFSDITLQVDHATFLHCHKVVLATHCDYFNSMLSSNMQEGQASLIAIKEVDPNIFKKLIQFIYEQQYHFTTIEDAFSLLEMAQRFLVSNLEAACVQFLASQLTKETAEEIFFKALASPSIELKTDVMQWMMRYYLMLPKALQMHIQNDEVWLEFYHVLIAQPKG